MNGDIYVEKQKQVFENGEIKETIKSDLVRAYSETEIEQLATHKIDEIDQRDLKDRLL